MQPPKIDNRTAADLAAQTGALATQLSGWVAPTDGTGDAGQALIGIFGRFAELVVERLNLLPEKNFLAFLNLIGAEPLSPRPARVPLTFTLADGAPVDGVVPAGTQVAAPPRQGDEDEVLFETEQELLVSRARMVAARVYDPWSDRSVDRLPPVEGALDAPFDVFTATQPVDHELYLACDSLLDDAAGRSVRIDLYSPDPTQWTFWPIVWSAWLGGAWEPLAVTTQYVTAEGRWQVTIPSLPAVEATTVNDVEAKWVRAQLRLPLAPDQHQLAPERAGPVEVERPAPLATPFPPFVQGEWYLDGGAVFGQAGATVEIDLTLAPGTGTPDPELRLQWQYLASDGTWKNMGMSGQRMPSIATTVDLVDGTEALTTSGQVQFRIPLDWDRQDHASRRGRWLRVRVAVGNYRVPPTITGLTFGWHWALPRVSRILVTSSPAGTTDGASPQPPELGFANNLTLDLGRDYTPFGTQPAYNDVFLVACEPALAQAGATVEVAVTLTNPANGTNLPVTAVKTDGKPVVAWEMFTNRGWQALVTSALTVPAAGNVQSLTASGVIPLTIPADVAATTVNGESRHWLRARLVNGNYGVAATYSGTAATGYTLVAATYSPPLIKTLRLTVTRPAPVPAGGAAGSPTQPVSACVTANGGTLVDRTAEAAAAGNDDFAPFTPLDERQATLYLGLDQPFAPRPFTLYAQVEPPRPEDVAAEMLMAPEAADPPRVAWEYSGAAGWSPLGPLDETADLTQPGLVHFIGPDDQTARPLFGQNLYWLAARWRSGTFLFTPQVRQVRLNTTWASAAATSRNEILGSSTGEPGQRFSTVNAPVLPGEALEVNEGGLAPPAPAPASALPGSSGQSPSGQSPDEGTNGTWVRWQARGDLHASGPQDRHYTIDRRTGTVEFGDGRQGMIPPLGQANLRLMAYRHGGGAAGNRAAGEIVELKSSLPYIDGVTNHQAAAGGFDQEPLERVKERGPATLRHRDRAVTARDLEDLAFAATPDVARVAVIVPDFDAAQLWLNPGARPSSGHRAVPAGRFGLVIVPHGTEARPAPGLQLLGQVRRHVLDRGTPTADLWVAGPEWVAIAVESRVVPTSLDQADTVVGTVRRALDAYLHPLTGGPQGRGWAFGVVPRRSDLHRVLEATPGVDHVRTLTVTITPVTSRGNQDALRSWLQRRATQTTTLNPDQREWQNWAGRSLVYAAGHTIRAVLDY